MKKIKRNTDLQPSDDTQPISQDRKRLVITFTVLILILSFAGSALFLRTDHEPEVFPENNYSISNENISEQNLSFLKPNNTAATANSSNIAIGNYQGTVFLEEGKKKYQKDITVTITGEQQQLWATITSSAFPHISVQNGNNKQKINKSNQGYSLSIPHAKAKNKQIKIMFKAHGNQLSGTFELTEKQTGIGSYIGRFTAKINHLKE